MHAINYRLIRAKRKSVSIALNGDGEVVVRAPRLATKAEIDRLVDRHADWIAARRASTEEDRLRMSAAFDGTHMLYHGKKVPCTENPLDRILNLATKELPELTKNISVKIGIPCGTIRISGARSYWGTCSSRGVIHLNKFLICLPESLMEYVVVHELTHLEFMNHSREFWNAVGRRIPYYAARKKELKSYVYLMRRT